MPDVLDAFIQRHRKSGILIDTNLLLAFLLAAWDEGVALKFKRTNAYTAKDLKVLKLIVDEFQQLIVTPAVLAEMSNLARHLQDPHRTTFFGFLSVVFNAGGFTERFTDLPKVVDDASCFRRLGFTDATIERLGTSGTPVLTDDALLYMRLQEQGIDSFNFNHVREWGLG